ncbi:MAG: TorF family putative porin [Betaproteobacteria bacterium]|nr:TorF family putative porin [Betaproteobacteria bacterium]
MLKQALTAGVLAAALTPGFVAAQGSSPHSLTGNVGLYSQYIFRGLTQTNKDPALQGGFDYVHASGLYAGTWASNISWLTDSSAVTGYSSSSLEIDFYGGFRNTIGKTDFGYDVGLLYYYYPGTHSVVVAPGSIKADTLELYGALTWKWLSAKYSYSIDNKTFGVANSDGTWYLDLSATFPVTDKLNLVAHYGKQEFKGNIGGVSNDSVASYDDWKIGATYSLPKDFTVGGFFSGTDMTAAQKAFYTNASDNRFVGKDTFTVFVSKTF